MGEIVAEVGGRLERAEPLEGRAVASSTNTIWITLARHVHSPVKLPKGERGPAARLLELGRSGRVILPLPRCPAARCALRRDRAYRRQNLAPVMMLLSPVLALSLIHI